MSLIHTTKEGLYAYSGLYLKREDLVLIYASGRVGSMGLIKDLRDAKVYSFKVESLEKLGRGTEKFVKKHFIDKNKPAQIISLVRDPMAMMISYYISKVNFGWLGDGLNPDNSNDIAKLQELFVKEALETDRLKQHLDWFKNEFDKFMGYSVYDFPFDTEKQYSFIEHEKYPALILRTELADEIKSQVLSDWLQTKITVTRGNTREQKSNPETYKQFKDTLHIPTPILEKIYNSEYVTHFFSKEEIESLKKKWS